MRKNLKKIATLAMAAAMAIAVVPAVPTQAAKTELIKNEWDSYFGASSGWAEGAEGAGAYIRWRAERGTGDRPVEWKILFCA